MWYEMHAKLLDTMENMGVPRNPETVRPSHLSLYTCH